MLEERIQEFVVPLEAFVKAKALDNLFTQLGMLFYCVSECNKNKKLPVDELYAKLKPVDDVLIEFAKLYEQMISKDAQIGLIALIKAFTNKTREEILTGIVNRKSKIVSAEGENLKPVKETKSAKKEKGS
jgi:hypothetical protein